MQKLLTCMMNLNIIIWSSHSHWYSLHSSAGMHEILRKVEGFGQIEGGSITPENAGIYLVRHTLGGLPAIEAAAYN